jgi:hypothetical protein
LAAVPSGAELGRATIARFATAGICASTGSDASASIIEASP